MNIIVSLVFHIGFIIIIIEFFLVHKMNNTWKNMDVLIFRAELIFWV